MLLSTFIYTFFTYGNPMYLYFVSLKASNGSVVSSRYKSNIGCNSVFGSVISEDYIVVSACNSYMLLFNLTSRGFNYKAFSGTLYGYAIERSTGRIVLGGNRNNNAYMTKFNMQSLSIHPDFQTTNTISMNDLPAGTNDITSDVGQAIGAVFSMSISPPSPMFTNLTVTYVLDFKSEAIYHLDDQSVSVTENTSSQITPDLTCSMPSSTQIIYSTVGLMGSAAPSWVSIDSSSGVLSITAPGVSVDTEYKFYVNSALNGITTPIQKLIKLTILDCIAFQCQKCISTSNSVCSICNSGYDLASGVCKVENSKPSETANALSKLTLSLVVTTIGISILTSIMNSSSLASIWMSINQMQLLFLLLLTRAFIPEDVQVIIKGCDFTSNAYEYIPFTRLSIYSSFVSNFEFELSNLSLQSQGINYDSTIANLSTSLVFGFSMIIFSILI